MALGWYARRKVVCINGNIILASVTSTLLTAAIISSLPLERLAAIVAATVAIDACIDVAVFFSLHLWSMRAHTSTHREHFPGTWDVLLHAGKIHAQRLVLIPLYYATASIVQSVLLMQGMAPGASVVVAYLSGLVVTRTIHTIYGLRTGLFS